VLFAERDADLRGRFERLSERAGWMCQTVDGVPSALQALDQQRFDIIVTDLIVADMTPREILQRMNTSAGADLTPLVIVVGSTGALSDPAALLRDGAADVLPSANDLRAIERAIDRIFKGVVPGESESRGYCLISSERSIWELTGAELAAFGKFPLYIAERLHRSGRIDRELKNRLDVVFQEALMNALDHGCLELDSAWREEADKHGVDRYSLVRAARLNDPSYAERVIVIETVLEKTQLTIRIADSGKGFDPTAKKPLSSVPLCSGRGLAIIKWGVDQVSFSKNGTEITLVKMLPS
jgi:CheY-like chemotaxis protein